MWYEVVPFHFGSKENGLRDQEKPLNVIGDACKKKNLIDHLAVSRLLREWPGRSVLVSI